MTAASVLPLFIFFIFFLYDQVQISQVRSYAPNTYEDYTVIVKFIPVKYIDNPDDGKQKKPEKASNHN